MPMENIQLGVAHGVQQLRLQLIIGTVLRLKVITVKGALYLTPLRDIHWILSIPSVIS